MANTAKVASNLRLYLQGFIRDFNRIFRDTSLSIHVFVNKKIVVLLNVSLNYISCHD